MSANSFWRSAMGEELVGIRMESATPWQVIDALRLACLDYVCAVEHFGLRSTLFFGKDWWPLHYKYDYDFVNTARTLPPGASPAAVQARLDINASRAATYVSHASAQSFVLDQETNPTSSQNVEPLYRRRPFLQVHVCHSGTNLIAAEVEATAEGWCRSVQAVGSYAGTLDAAQSETSAVQYVDSDIFPEFQNMRLVQSGLYSTTKMRVGDATRDLNPGETVMSTNALNNYAVGALHDEVREMYQGSVYQTGDGFVRPRHLVHLVDAMRLMSGAVEVKEVTHSFGPGGFVTTWSPDCVAFAQDLFLSHMHERTSVGANNGDHQRSGDAVPLGRAARTWSWRGTPVSGVRRFANFTNLRVFHELSRDYTQ